MMNYSQPDESVMAKVVDEKLIRVETRAVLKTGKYGEVVKDSLEKISFGDIAEGDNEGEQECFFSHQGISSYFFTTAAY